MHTHFLSRMAFLATGLVLLGGCGAEAASPGTGDQSVRDQPISLANQVGAPQGWALRQPVHRTGHWETYHGQVISRLDPIEVQRPGQL
jgi:hypothetical protein